MPFASLVGNERIKKLLRRAVREGRVSQGLIFAGPAGVGKHRFAIAFAQAVNCLSQKEGDACGHCTQCIKIEAREHVDVETISPDGQFIKIEQMRKLSEAAQFRPYEGRRRVFIIDQAHRLRVEAANSILKTLEEPPPTSLLLLVTSKPYALIETIRSRCLMLSFAPLAVGELESFLETNYRRPADETRLLARLARGSVGRALEIDLGQYKEKRRMMIEIIEALSVRRDTVRLLNAAEYMSRKLEREEFEDHLDTLLVLLMDMFHLKLGRSKNALINADISDHLARIAEAMSIELIIDWVEKIEELLANLARNLNRHVALDAMFVSL
ncbi:MAG: DNA polymerase III subunit delta' [Acidobacteriota bacterium]